MDEQLHSLTRRLIELRMEHAELNAAIDRLADQAPVDELAVQRLKKRRLALRDMIARLELETTPDEPA
ncbi:YdcH family protein [Roseateles sp. DC23W]|uniref:YdcH family protein n=1 Tax=Pelomonas dachongensis TaxID=3299029 RepID=A0ABW7EQV0_9BURK